MQQVFDAHGTRPYGVNMSQRGWRHGHGFVAVYATVRLDLGRAEHDTYCTALLVLLIPTPHTWLIPGKNQARRAKCYRPPGAARKWPSKTPCSQYSFFVRQGVDLVTSHNSLRVSLKLETMYLQNVRVRAWRATVVTAADVIVKTWIGCITGRARCCKNLRERKASGDSATLPASVDAHRLHGVELARCLDVAVEAAKLAGDVMAKAFRDGNCTVQHKGKVDLVTETDTKCEKLVRDHLMACFPDHLFIGEEDVSATGQVPELTEQPTWMVDPLDGTTNFVHGFPFTCVSIGLAINKEPLVGVVYNPILNEMFTAVKGGGAKLNGEPISVTHESDIGNALVATEVGVTRTPEAVAKTTERLGKLIAKARSLRCCGSCAMNLVGVACGRLDAFFEIGFGGCWDVAAGAIILQEAGGKVADPLTGGAFDLMARKVLGTNSGLLSSMVEILAE
eukprot:jgi/Mesvir1/26684/Mv20465-RA.1